MNKKPSLLLELYKDKRTVFTFNDLALILMESDKERLKQKVNYHVRNKSIMSLRRGIYAKIDYDAEELACKINTPSYLSLEYVLRKAGAIFQYSEAYTVISYLSRSIEVDSRTLLFRRVKESVLLNTKGIERLPNGVNIATPERALLDLLYLDHNFYLDHPKVIKKEAIYRILPIYQSNTMKERIKHILSA